MKWFYLSLLMIAGCSSHYTQHLPWPQGQVVEVDTIGPVPSWLPAAVASATSEWNTSLNGHLYLTVGHLLVLPEQFPNNMIAVLAVHDHDAMILATHLSGAIAATYPCGSARPSSLIYLVTDDISSPTQGKNIMLHELGHAIGAEDTEDDSLMSRRYIGRHCVDQKTVQQIAKVWGWEINSLNYCESY